MNIVSRTGSLTQPLYSGKGKTGERLGLAVESMKRHMTDEGWQLFQGLEEGGYRLCGNNLPESSTDALDLVARYDPQILVLQDKREWEGGTAGAGYDPKDRFHNVSALKNRQDMFKLTVLKDAQNRPDYHRGSAEEIGCHAWIVYYHPSRVYAVAPYVRLKHLVRTYHTVDRELVPPYSPFERKGVLLSGAVSSAYPLRTRLYRERNQLLNLDVLPHPGYHRKGSATPDFLKTLSKYKVAICTASMYGYALRKIVEATACGCRVLTDLTSDDVLPEIDGNLTRIDPRLSTKEVAAVLQRMLISYDPSAQETYARAAIKRYDYRVEGKRLSDEIEKLRQSY